jgi:hypothetical protein
MKKLLLILSLIITVLSIHAQSWSALGGTTLAANNQILSTCTDASGNVYAAGFFTAANGSLEVAKWNESSWSALTGGITIQGNFISSICIDKNGNLYATGQLSNFGGGFPFVAKWNGSSWSELGGAPITTQLGTTWAMCTDRKGNVYAAVTLNGSKGVSFVAEYNGTTWIELGSNNSFEGVTSNEVAAICTDTTGSLYAAGWFTDANGKNYVARWDGTNWNELGGTTLAVSGTIGALCTDGNSNLYAAGPQNVYEWNGVAWSNLGLGTAASLCTDASDNVYAGGSFTDGNGKYYVAKYGGVDWIELGGTTLAANSVISTVCTDASSNVYTAGFFTNTSGQEYVAVFNPSLCGTPTNLTATSITSATATLGWGAVTNDTGYNVRYQISGLRGWINGFSKTNSLAISGLTPSTTYKFQVETLCASGISPFSALFSFTTAAAPTCGVPANLTATSITPTAATLGWGTVTNDTGYNVRYEVAGTTNWTNVSSKTNSLPISGLTASTTYQFQVQTLCASGFSAYSVLDSFTTLPATPTGLTVGNITNKSAIITWNPVLGASYYIVQLKNTITDSVTTSFIKKNTDSTGGLTGGSTYSVKVATVGNGGATSPYTPIDSFTTLPDCSDIYEPNNTSATASPIPTNTAIAAMIGTATDVDWYSFSTTSPNKDVKVALTNLPADYDISLYKASPLTLLGTSKNTGTTSEQIIWDTAAAGKYYVEIFGFNSETLGDYNFTADNAIATGVAAKLSIATLIQGNNNGTTALVTKKNPSSGYKGSSGTYNAEAAARTGALSIKTNGSAYFQFTLTPTAGNVVTLTGISFGAFSTSTGPVSYALRSSLDNYASNITTGTIANTSAWALKTKNGFTVTSAAGTAITFRIYGYGGTGTVVAGTANFHIDDLILTGSVNAFDATNCYTLTVSTSSSPFSRPAELPVTETTNINTNGMKLYPVPAHGSLTVSFNALKTGRSTIQVMNELGSIIKTTSVSTNIGANNSNLNLAGLKPGMYLLRITDGNTAETKKFIIGN